MQAFLDSTGGLWQAGALVGKPCGIFVSVGTQGGGSETTALTFVTQVAHHGMVFVPCGYSFGAQLFGMDEVCAGGGGGGGEGLLRLVLGWAVLLCWACAGLGCGPSCGIRAATHSLPSCPPTHPQVRGGTPYGASTFAGADGSRQPSKLELDYAHHQGAYFAGVAKKLAA